MASNFFRTSFGTRFRRKQHRRSLKQNLVRREPRGLAVSLDIRNDRARQASEGPGIALDIWHEASQGIGDCHCRILVPVKSSQRYGMRAKTPC
jgi:hypothetical protein